MKVGTVCYATSRGLGHLAKNFIDAGIINDICVVNHPGVPRNHDWYPDAPSVNIRGMDRKVLVEYVKGHDAMLFFETPFDWSLIDVCKGLGIRTYLVTMHECTPEGLPSMPYILLCPSELDFREFNYPNSRLVDIPVEVPWKERNVAKVFVHNGGYLGLRGREGTQTLIEAMRFVRSPIELIIRVQENVSPVHVSICKRDKRISYRPETVPFAELYETGDVYIAPQKFNGMSMPLLEARASGMAIMTTDRFPTNSWLHHAGIFIPVRSREMTRLASRFRQIEISNVSPMDLAICIDHTYGKDITPYSMAGRIWAELNTFSALKQEWLEILAK